MDDTETSHPVARPPRSEPDLPPTADRDGTSRRSFSMHEQVPVRTIVTAIGLLLVTAATLYALVQVRQVLTWLIVAAFFAVALSPLVGWLQRHGLRRRSLATLLVFVLVVAALIGLSALFVVPLATEGRQLAEQLPDLVKQARDGKGPVGDLLQRFDVLGYVQQHQDEVKTLVSRVTSSSAGVLRAIAGGVAALLTIFVLAYLMVLEGPKAVEAVLNLFRPQTGERVRSVTADCGRAITGYISGNLLLSLICGLFSYVVLRIMGVPFAALIAVFVGLMDLIPLVGATIGAAVAAFAGFVHSLPAGIVLIVFFVVYQQVENNLLQPMVYARTVQLNALTVIVSVLIATQLAGLLGALLAIPVASMVQVVVRDLWDHRAGRPKSEPTVGEDREPA